MKRLKLALSLWASKAGGIALTAAPLAQLYLEEMVELAWRGTLVPLGIAAIGILGGMTPWVPGLWSNIIALAGIVSFLYLGLLAALAAPIGALIGAAMPSGQIPTRTTPQAVTWRSLLSPDWIVRLIREAGQWTADQLREGVERYFSLVRKVLAWEVFIFFFVAAAPAIRGATLILILGAIALAVSSKYLSEGWARVVRVAAVVLMAWWVLGSIFPALDPFTNIFGTSAKELTLGKVAVAADKGLALDSGNWKKPSFWIGIAVVALLAYLAVKLFKKAAAPAGGTTTGGSVHHAAVAPSHGSGGTGSGWLGKAALGAVIILCLGWLALQVMDFDHRRTARLEAGERDAQLNEEARAAMRATPSRLVAEVNGRRTSATQVATPAAPEVWHGILSPQKYSVVLSTNLSDRIPRPIGLSVWVEPEGLPYELWANGRQVARTPGTTKIPRGTTFVQYRWTNPTPTNLIIGVGKLIE